MASAFSVSAGLSGSKAATSPAAAACVLGFVSHRDALIGEGEAAGRCGHDRRPQREVDCIRGDGPASDSATARGEKTVSPGGPGMGLTSSSNDALACGADVSAVAKLAAGRAVISVVRTVSRIKSCTKLGWRKRTSVLAGCTFTSTSCGGISRKSSTTG